jgi:broad specificity phosphatase PhoE
MKNSTILVTRHAEKSSDPLDPDLTPEGHERAKRLATYIPDTFGKPDFLFATTSVAERSGSDTDTRSVPSRTKAQAKRRRRAVTLHLTAL